MRDEDIVAAARDIRAVHPDLLTDEPGSSSAALDALLRRADQGEQVGDEILMLLTVDPRIREELRRRLPQEQDTSRTALDGPAYSAMPGHGEPSTEILYRCSACGYEYPVFEVGEPEPEGCPRGHGPLFRVV